MTDFLRLDKRLRAVVDGVEGSVLVDVGCDHGKVSVACLSENKARRVIACDISQKSLQKAVELSRTFGVKNIEFRVGDGLSVIADDEADCAVIAGMGGKEIMKILAHMPRGIKRLILSPQKNTIELREFLSVNGFYIESDFVVEESGKFYDIIVAKLNGGKDCALDRAQLLLGKNQQGADFDKYINLIKQKQAELSKKNPLCEQCKLYEEMIELDEERRNCRK